MTATTSQTAAYIWNLADLLRGDFKQSQYGRVILPFTILRRLECVLESGKGAVLAQVEKFKSMKLEEDAREKFLLKAAGKSFYNTSAMDLSKLGSADTQANLLTYVQSFSADAREIFEHFRFDEFVTKLSDANLLYKVVQKVASMDLSPEALSNHEMGLIFEELIRRFAESSNETAGEHFTPRDIVRLTTSLVFMEDDEALSGKGIIRTIYDPTAGTGGFLSSGMEYVHELNANAKVVAYGQELNPESYAICKGDMLIKGQEVANIKRGNTLSEDQLRHERFDYMLSNPPFGVDWKKIETDIKTEHKVKGFDGRFGPGVPRVSDGSLLFLMHLITKMRDYDINDDENKPGGRIGIILNGSPLFTGGAGSGESEIRRYILESDLLEAIVALPTDMFYNTGIATYVWILSNKKKAERKGKVQLINGVHLHNKMRKSLGSKRHEIGDKGIRLITRTFGEFEVVPTRALDESDGAKVKSEAGATRGRKSSKKEVKKTFASKIFASHAFGYRRIQIERPLRLSAQLSDERIETLRFATGRLNAPMQSIYEKFAGNWSATNAAGAADYGDLTTVEAEVRALCKAEHPELKEKHIKDLLERATWERQCALMDHAKALQGQLGTETSSDFNKFETKFNKALKTLAADTDVKLDGGFKLDSKQKKELLGAITWTDPDAEPVIKKVLKIGAADANPLYGEFVYSGGGSKARVVNFAPDSSLRDNEDVPLTPETARGSNKDGSDVDLVNEAYFNKEVAPHVADAWIDAAKRDAKDGEVGIVGYEIPFNRHFYEYEPPRDLAEIDADLDVLSGEIMQMLREMRV